MDKGNHPIAVFYLYSVGIHGSICRCEIYIYTDWRRRKSGADIICYCTYCGVYIYCCFRKILLWIRLCIWKSWRWSECIIQTDLQKDEKETGADSGPDCRQTCISEICDSAIIVFMCYGGVYNKAQGTSPWDVFSMIHAGNFKLNGYLIGLVILVLLIVGMCLEERFFCRNFCPMGAVFSLVPVLPTFALHRDRESCIPKCSACSRKCPANIGLPTDGSWKVEGDCFQCQKCIDTCPKKNIHCGVKKIRGNEIWFTILRALILLGLCIWLGV